MADELGIKIPVEVDEAASTTRIKAQLPKLEAALKGTPIKIPVEADTDSIKESVKKAAKSSKSSTAEIPVKVTADSTYLKRALIEDFRKLKAQAGTFKLDTSVFEKAFNTGALKTAKQELTILQKHLRAVSAESKATLPDLAITNFSKNVNSAVAQTDKLKAQFKSLSTGIPADVGTKISGLRTELERLAQIPVGEATEQDIQKFNSLSTVMDGLKNNLTQLKATDKNFKLDIGADKLQTDIKNVQQKLLNMKVIWSKAFTKPEYAAAWQELWDKSTSGAIQTRAQITALNSEISLMGKQIVGAGLNVKTFWGTISDNVKKFSSWFFIGNTVAGAVRSLRSMVDAVKSVDLQMTELRKVTDETNATYDKFFKSASKRAAELATSLDKYIGSVADFSRMGFSIPDSQILADAATIYYNVGDGMSSMEDATSSIISTLKAYSLSADQATRITDIFNETSNRFAVTSAGIGEGMQRAGAALAVANTSLEKSVALFTAMDEVIQNDESSATSLRFIAQRMRNTAGELEAMGEDADGAAESVTKLQQQILKLTGVNIMSDSENFRDVYDVLKDISDVWDKISDKDQADVVRLMAGTRQSAAFSALMQNFSSAEEALDVALNSAGSAYKENIKWLNSIEAKQQKTQAAFEVFSNTIMSSDLIKGAYDTGTGVLGFLSTLTEKLGALPVLATAAAAALSFKTQGSNMPLLAHSGAA